MNSLSLWLYLTDIFGSLDSTSMAFTIISGLLFAIFLIAFFVSTEDKDEIGQKLSKKSMHWCSGIFLGAVTLTTFIPSQKTMYMILASEVGEEVIISEEMDLVREAIQKKLDEYVNEEE